MNCRRVNGLLSAYLDGELTGAEMLEIRAHLDSCASCHAEHQALRDTKRLVASLAYKAPRAELESLLADRTYRRGESLTCAALPAAALTSESGAPAGLRPWPIAATILLSLTGLYLASTAVNPPGSGSPLYDSATPSLAPVFLTSRIEDSPVALTALSPNVPVAVWSGGAPVGTVVVGAPPMQMTGGIPLPFSPGHSSASVTVMSNGRGDMIRVIRQSVGDNSGQVTITSATTIGGVPFVSSPAPGWQSRGDRAPVGLTPAGSPSVPVSVYGLPGGYIIRHVGIR